MNGPIADLTYRNYDGPLAPATMRWWVIAKMTMRMALKKKSMWVAMAFSAWYYLCMIFVLYFIDQFGQSNSRPGQTNPAASFIGRLVWKDQFLHGFAFGQIMFLVIALIIGAGAIANDNRANALLVYLSKPCTKTDYLFGKWIGVFIPLFAVMVIPSLVFFGYGALSYRDQGFLWQDPWLFPKLISMLALGATLHSSLIIGFSSLFNQGRIAGATYAGLYFLTNFFTQMMTVLWITNQGGRRGRHEIPPAAYATLSKLYYASIDGINIGMAKAILGTDGTPPFGIPGQMKMVPHPNLPAIILIVLVLSAASLSVAWTRIKAVEVVG